MSKTMYDGLLASIYDYSPYFGKSRSGISSLYLSKLENIPSRIILELGTATGLLTIPVLKAGFYVDTVDYSEDMQCEAKKKLNNYGAEISRRVKFVMEDITKYTPEKKYGAVMIPDSLLLILPEAAELKGVLRMCCDALVHEGLLLFDIYIPNENEVRNKKRIEAARFKDANGDVCIVEANHTIDEQYQLMTGAYTFKKRLMQYKYMQMGSATIKYHYKCLSQITELLEESGFCDIEAEKVLDNNVYFIVAKKMQSYTTD